ncbi:MAG: MNIO family bufferin maturase [Burkholderiales bacterium]
MLSFLDSVRRNPGAAAQALPIRAGVGLKSAHFREIVETEPTLGFFEVHAENYMVEGGPFHHYLTRIRGRYPLSMHGVGLSIGADAPLDRGHLDALVALLDRYEPQSFSEHLAWSTHGDVFLNDLLPLSYTATTLQRVCDHIDQVQTHLRRRMLLENPATYVEFSESTMTEAAFITDVVRRTGCGLLLDVNNVYVSSVNHHRDPRAYIQSLPLDQCGEIHLAGFAEQRDSHGDPLLIDSHGSPVAQAVWDLYAFTLAYTGPVPTLIERDNDVPALAVLVAEAKTAEERLLARQAGTVYEHLPTHVEVAA